MRCILCSSFINGHTVAGDIGRSNFSSGLLYSSDGCTVWHQCSHHRSVSKPVVDCYNQFLISYCSLQMLQRCCWNSICWTLYILVCTVGVKTFRYCLLNGSSANFDSISVCFALWRFRFDYDFLIN